MSAAATGAEGVSMSDLGDRDRTGVTGVPNGPVLQVFADAVVDRDPDAIDRTRSAVVDELDYEAMVEAAAVVANFERMVRIADGCGIAVDAPMVVLTEDIRREVGIDRFVAAANTPRQGTLTRLAWKAVGVPLFRFATWRASRGDPVGN